MLVLNYRKRKLRFYLNLRFLLEHVGHHLHFGAKMQVNKQKRKVTKLAFSTNGAKVVLYLRLKKRKAEKRMCVFGKTHVRFGDILSTRRVPSYILEEFSISYS